MATMTADQIQSIEERFPQVFQRPFHKRFGPLMLLGGIFLYLLYALWFFNLPQVMRESHWERLPLFLTQWISYDVQPIFRLDEPQITAKYPRFSVLGPNPDPDWVKTNADGSVTILIDGTAKSITFTKTQATIIANGETVAVALGTGKPLISGPVPGWITAHEDEVVADMGFAGEARVAVDRVRIRKRFLGWANFVFDTRSPFFGKSASEVASLIVSGPELKPGTSNLALAGDNIWNNAQWQHGDVWTKLLQTIVMAFLGTMLGG
ncbi:phosphonate ABC transporter, permease protein PhnE, partial [Mesorhizobium sp. M7A.F.Ca.US.002.01.1.1]